MSGLDKVINILYENKSEIVLLLFTANWCKPCKELKNRLEDTTDEYVQQLGNLKYIVVDIDEEDNDEICEKLKVNNIPYQVFVTLIKNNDTYEIKILDKLIGNDIIGLISKYKNLLSEFSN